MILFLLIDSEHPLLRTEKKGVALLEKKSVLIFELGPLF